MASQRTSDVYPRLYHYTTVPGAHSILTNNQLWATHYKFMNDYSEIVLFRDKLIEFLRPHVLEEFEDLIAEDAHARERIEAEGGLRAAADHDTAGFVTAFYETIPDEIYLVALCGEHKDPYINANGLLSQWRGYGADGGVAIVLRTQDLETLLAKEADRFDYAAGHISDVVYSDNEGKFARELTGPLTRIADHVRRMFMHMKLGKEGAPDEGGSFESFIQCISRYKHRGFGEENEVRIVAVPIPHTPKLLLAAKGSGVQMKPEKERKFRAGARGSHIPYIELFGSLYASLPVDEVIVGPHKDKEARASALRVLLKNTDIKVSVSEIPYVC